MDVDVDVDVDVWDFRTLPAFVPGRIYIFYLENGNKVLGTYYRTREYDSLNGQLIDHHTGITRHIFTHPNSTLPIFLDNTIAFSIENFTRDQGGLNYPVINTRPALFHLNYNNFDYKITNWRTPEGEQNDTLIAEVKPRNTTSNYEIVKNFDKRYQLPAKASAAEASESSGKSQHSQAPFRFPRRVVKNLTELVKEPVPPRIRGGSKRQRKRRTRKH